MKHALFSFALLIAFFAGCCGHQTIHPIYDYRDKPKQELVQHLEKSSIVLLAKNPDTQRYVTSCAGVWISDDKILTARHCAEAQVEDHDNILLPTADLTKLPGVVVAYKTYEQINQTFKLGRSTKPHFAVIIAYDPNNDLAVLETIDHPEHENIIISSAVMFDGEDVHIIGHTSGMEYTYFPGVISNADRIMNPFGPDWRLIQIAAPAWGGNSGGGVFDASGRLLGIFSFIKVSVPNMGFAVHRDEILQFLSSNNLI